MRSVAAAVAVFACGIGCTTWAVGVEAASPTRTVEATDAPATEGALTVVNGLASEEICCARSFAGSPARRPSVELGSVYSRGSAPTAAEFADWADWCLGKAASWSARAIKLRFRYAGARGATPVGAARVEPLSDDFDLVAEWYPTRWLQVGVLVGYAHSGSGVVGTRLPSQLGSIDSEAMSSGAHATVHAALAVGIDVARWVFPR